MQQTIDRLAAPVGRILLGILFLAGGLMKIPGWAGTIGYMQSAGMPAAPVFLALATLVEVLGGAALILGYRSRWAALLLFLFLIPVTLVFHRFWEMADMMQAINMSMFLKNLAIMGGLLFIAAHGSGGWSLERPATR